LQERTILPVGAQTPVPVELRVIAATHRDLLEEVRRGRFREDLYYRLQVVTLRLPPLRERPEDIPLLARHFLKHAGCPNPDEVLGPEVMEVLATRAWPGNARELRNVVERAVVLRDTSQQAFIETDVSIPRSALDAVGRAAAFQPAAIAAKSADAAVDAADDQVALARIASSVAHPRPSFSDDSWLQEAMPKGWLDRPYKETKADILEQFERHYLEHQLFKCGANISRIAARAEVDRHLVRKLLRKHGLIEGESDH
jgi:DNA-binding NtrC family response regulator